jgi:tetratricopeptide (TPR) repeat protein
MARLQGWTALLLVLALLCAAPALSEVKKRRRGAWGRSSGGPVGEEQQWTRQYEVGPRAGRRIIEAREALLAEQWDAAAAALEKLNPKYLNPLERAEVNRIYAFIEYGRGDLDRARDYLEKTLAENALETDGAAAVRFQIAQLYLQEERWSEAAASFEKWFELGVEPNGNAYYMLALAYFQAGDLEKALEPAKQAVDHTSDPREGWLQLLLAIQLTRKDYEAALPVLEMLVVRYPTKGYWLNLATVHGALGNFEEALIRLQLAHEQDLLTTDAELRRLAQLLMFLDLPYRAALVLEEGYADGILTEDTSGFEMLSNSWIAAREYEKAVEPLEKAASLAPGGELYVRLAQVHLQREKWGEAASALGRALDKGGLDNPGDAELLMGIAIYSQKKPAQARPWFSRARKHDASREEADVWIKHLERELAAAG